MKYIISTIGKDLVTVTDKELAEKFFEQNKEKYSYLKLSEEITNPYPHNGKYTVRKSIAISYRQKEEEQTSFFFMRRPRTIGATGFYYTTDLSLLSRGKIVFF